MTTNAERLALADKLDRHARNFTNSYNYCTAAVLTAAASLIRAQPAEAGEPVAWQVFHEVDGWGPCHSSDLAYYKSYGVKTRPLYATDAILPLIADQSAALAEAREALDELCNTLEGVSVPGQIDSFTTQPARAAIDRIDGVGK